MRRAAISRRAFERAYSKQFGTTLKVAHKARIYIETHMRTVGRQPGFVASAKGLKAHPIIAARKLAAAKAAVTRALKARAPAKPEKPVRPVKPKPRPPVKPSQPVPVAPPEEVPEEKEEEEPEEIEPEDIEDSEPTPEVEIEFS